MGMAVYIAQHDVFSSSAHEDSDTVDRSNLT